MPPWRKRRKVINCHSLSRISLIICQVIETGHLWIAQLEPSILSGVACCIVMCRVSTATVVTVGEKTGQGHREFPLLEVVPGLGDPWLAMSCLDHHTEYLLVLLKDMNNWGQQVIGEYLRKPAAHTGLHSGLSLNL